MKIRRTYYLTETGEPLGSVEGEFPSSLATHVLSALKEGADKTANGRPYYYVDGKALSCEELDRISFNRPNGEGDQ